MSRPAMAVARVGCGRLWASITCEKLARDPHDAYAHRATRCRAGPRRGSAGRHSDEARAARRRGVTTRARGIRVGSDGRAAGGPGVDRLGGGEIRDAAENGQHVGKGGSATADEHGSGAPSLRLGGDWGNEKADALYLDV